MSESKRDRVRNLLHRAIYDAIALRALEYPEDAAVLKRHAINLRNDAACRVYWDRYRMKELQDIMDWKPGPKRA